MTRKYMFQKITLGLLALLLSIPYSFADEMAIAKRKLNASSLRLFKDTVGYKVFRKDGGGFCIVKDSCVVAYSNSGSVTKSTITSVLFPQKKRSLNNHIYDTIRPLLSNIKFNQHDPFNNALPSLNGEKCITGCVPVAVAQVMKYYNYPPYTIADIPSFKTKTAKLDMDSIPKLTRFDWQNIQPYYDSKMSEEKKDAAANLMKVVCTACYTDLQVEGSPTYYTNAFAALVKYFAYDINKIHIAKSSNYPLIEFEKLVYKELSNQRPLLLANYNHAFICDGYENGLFHVNWGWGGLMDGYFDMSLLAEKKEKQQEEWDTGMSATLGLVPNIVDIKVPITTNLWVSNFSDPQIPETLPSTGEIKGTIYCCVHSTTYKEITSYINAGYSDGKGKWVLIGEKEDYKGSYGWGEGRNIKIHFNSKDNAKYRIVPLEKCDGKDWEPMENSYYKYLDVVVENGKIKVCPPVQYNVKADVSFVEQEDGHYVKLDLTNTGYEDFCDTFYVKLNDLKGYLAAQELTVPANGSNSVLYQYSDSVKVSKYEVKVFDSNHKLLAESTIAPDQIKPHVDESIAQDSVSQDSITGEASEVSTPRDPGDTSTSLIVLGVMLAIFLFVFFKIFG